MIFTDHHSNLVILADGMKACVTNILSNAMMAANEAQEVVSGKRTTPIELMRPIMYKSHQRHAELNLIMNAAFFLESYINTFDYELNNSNPEYNFEAFVNYSTVKKWESHFAEEHDFLGNLKNLFNYRNFLAHSKPIRRNSGVSEVYVQRQGWKPVISISSLVKNELGLAQENYSVEELKNICNLTNLSVDLIDSKSPGFNRHYSLKIDLIAQFNLIEDANTSFIELSNKLKPASD